MPMLPEVGTAEVEQEDLGATRVLAAELVTSVPEQD
jgi:hypothetical protein